MIEVTGIDLKKFAKVVYQLSPPTKKDNVPTILSDTIAGFVLEARGIRNWRKYVLDMHTVHGRDCNMTVFESDDGKWFIADTWAGHTTEQFDQLLKYFNLKKS